MSVEDRLRAGLREVADAWSPEVERSLSRVRRRDRRNRWRVVGAAAAAVAVVAASFSLGLAPRMVGMPAASGSPVPDRLAGRFEGVVDAPQALAGRWVLGFNPDGILEVEAPPGYHGVLSSVLFRADADRVTTTIFQEDVCSGAGVGTYTWSRTASMLTLETKVESCAARQEFLAGTTWRSTG